MIWEGVIAVAPLVSGQDDVPCNQCEVPCGPAPGHLGVLVKHADSGPTQAC